MAKDKTHVSATPATKWLKQHHISFSEHTYHYIEHGGAPEAARQLGLDLHRIAKTLIMQDEHAKPLVVLMHGDCEVSTKNLARQAGVKKIEPCQAAMAQRHSGYFIGGTSPFGLRKSMPIFIEASLLEQQTIYVNGGQRGYLIGVASDVLVSALGAVAVQVQN